MKKTLIIAGLAAAALGGAIVGIPSAEAAKGGTATLTPAQCALVLKAWPSGDCDTHMQARVDRLVEDAKVRIRANRAADVPLLDKADIVALDAKIKIKKDALKALEPKELIK